MNKHFCMLILLLGATTARTQNVGIGTNSPVAKLDIRSDATSSSTNALMVKNGVGDTLIRVRNTGNMNLKYNGTSTGRSLNIGGPGINFFYDDNVFSGSIWPSDTSLVLWSATPVAEDRYVILQPAWGKVGIGTYAPRAKLEVSGDVILGSGGTTITRVIKQTLIRNIGNVSPGTSTTQTFTVTGARPGSTVYISPEEALPDGLIIAYARVSANDVVEVKFRNVTDVIINPNSMNYYITVIE